MKGKQMEGGMMKKVKKKGMESRKSGGWSKDLSHTVNETGGRGEGRAKFLPTLNPATRAAGLLS